MLTNDIEHDSLQSDIFNIIIGHEENESNSKKKQRSKRMFAARRAIEKHKEAKLLAEHVDEIWV
jgi:hypothetical protein